MKSLPACAFYERGLRGSPLKMEELGDLLKLCLEKIRREKEKQGVVFGDEWDALLRNGKITELMDMVRESKCRRYGRIVLDASMKVPYRFPVGYMSWKNEEFWSEGYEKAAGTKISSLSYIKGSLDHMRVYLDDDKQLHVRDSTFPFFYAVITQEAVLQARRANVDSLPIWIRGQCIDYQNSWTDRSEIQCKDRLVERYLVSSYASAMGKSPIQLQRSFLPVAFPEKDVILGKKATFPHWCMFALTQNNGDSFQVDCMFHLETYFTIDLSDKSEYTPVRDFCALFDKEKKTLIQELERTEVARDEEEKAEEEEEGKEQEEEEEEEEKEELRSSEEEEKGELTIKESKQTTKETKKEEKQRKRRDQNAREKEAEKKEEEKRKRKRGTREETKRREKKNGKKLNERSRKKKLNRKRKQTKNL